MSETDRAGGSAYEMPTPEQVAAAELAERRSKYMAKMEGLVESGLLRANIHKYARPWPEAVANNPEAWALAKRWHPSMGNLYAFGPNGVGKSALMRYVLAQAIWRGIRVAEASGPQFALRLASYEQDAMLTQLERVPILFLDDLDKGAWNPRALAYLWDLIDLRRERERATLVTANMDNAHMHALLHRGAGGRDEDCMATAIMRRLQPLQSLPMQGDDLRALTTFGSWGRTQ